MTDQSFAWLFSMSLQGNPVPLTAAFREFPTTTQQIAEALVGVASDMLRLPGEQIARILGNYISTESLIDAKRQLDDRIASGAWASVSFPEARGMTFVLQWVQVR